MKTIFRRFAGAAVLALFLPLSCNTPAGNNTESQKPDTLTQVVQAITDSILNGQPKDRVTKNLHFAPEGTDYEITWTSSNEDVISKSGKVTRPEDMVKVTVSAEVVLKTNPAAKKPFRITVTVIGMNQTAIEEELKKIPEALPPVIGTANQITLPAAGNEFAPKWKAEPADIINTTNGAVTKRPAEKTTVTLTLTLTKGETSRSKNIQVTVYPAGYTPTDDELLQTIVLPVPLPDEYQLKQEINGKPVQWTSSNQAVLKINANNSVTVVPDLADQTASLTAELSNNGKNTARVFPITVPAQTHFTEKLAFGNGTSETRTYRFSGNTLEFTRNHHTKGKYRIVLDAAKKHITLTQTHEWRDTGWVTMEAIRDEEMTHEQEYIKRHIDIVIPGCKALAALPTIDFQTFRQKIQTKDEEQLTDEQFFNSTINRDYAKSYTDFQAETAEKQAAILKGYIETKRSNFASNVFEGKKPDASWEEIAAYAAEKRNSILESARKYFEKEYNQMVQPVRYQYRIEKNSTGGFELNLKTVYDAAKPWYNQNGEYLHDDYGVSINHRGDDLLLHIWQRRNGDTRYRGILKTGENGAFSIPAEQGNETLSGQIESKSAGTITLTINGGSSYDLTFQGSVLW